MKGIMFPFWARLRKGLLLLGALSVTSLALANPDSPEARWQRNKEQALELYRDLLTRPPESEYFAARNEGFEGTQDPLLAQELRDLEARDDWDVALALEILRDLADKRDGVASAGGRHLTALTRVEEARRICEARKDLFDARRILKATAGGLVMGVCACGLAEAVDMFNAPLNGTGPGGQALPWEGAPDSGTCPWEASGLAETFGALTRERGAGLPTRSVTRAIWLLVPPIASGMTALWTRHQLSNQAAAVAEILERGTRILEKATGMDRLGNLIRLYAW